MIDDTALDTLLAASRPAVEDDPARVTRARAAAERNRSSRPWLRRAAVLGTAGAAVLAVGTGAAATVGLPFVYHVAPVEYTQTVASGDHCYTTYEFVPDGAASPAALAAAQEALATLDISALDISDELRFQTESNAKATWEGTGPRPDFYYPEDSLDFTESMALNRAVFEAVVAHVKAQGFKTRNISMTTDGVCDDMKKGEGAGE